MLAEAKVKAVTGQDDISCRFLYGEFFSYKPQYKIFFALNHKPVIRGTDRGIWRRIRLVPFTQSFEGREDRQLKDKLLIELPGVLNWALEGLRKFGEDGLGVPGAVKAATEQYRKESDVLGQWLEEHTKSDAAATLSASEAYKEYKRWAEELGHFPMSQTNFGRSMTERGFEKGRVNSGYYYKGLRLVYGMSPAGLLD